MKKLILIGIILLFVSLNVYAQDLSDHSHEELTMIESGKFNKTQSYQLKTKKAGKFPIEKIHPSIKRIITPLNSHQDYYYVEMEFDAIKGKITIPECMLDSICESIIKMREEASKDIERANIAIPNKTEYLNLTNRYVLDELVYLEYKILKGYSNTAFAEWHLISARPGGLLYMELKDDFDILQFFQNLKEEIIKFKNSTPY